MNPAALKTNLKDLEPGGILIVNSDAFGDRRPGQGRLQDQSAGRRLAQGLPRLLASRSTSSTARRSPSCKLSTKEADRCKNFFALGLVYWLYDRPLEPTLQWIREKFGKNPAVLEANTRTL